MSRHIAAHTAPGETIFQWGFEPQIYFYSGRRPASRYLANVMPMLESDPDVAMQRLHRELVQRRPRYLVIDEREMRAPGFDVISALIRDLDYGFEATFPYLHRGQALRLGLFRLP